MRQNATLPKEDGANFENPKDYRGAEVNTFKGLYFKTFYGRNKFCNVTHLAPDTQHNNSNMTLNISGIKTHSIMTLSITTLNLMTLSITTLSIVILSVVYAKCQVCFAVMLSVIMINVVIRHITILSVVAPFYACVSVTVTSTLV